MTARRNHGMTNPAKSLTNPPIPPGTPTSRRHLWERRRLVGTPGNADVSSASGDADVSSAPWRMPTSPSAWRMETQRKSRNVVSQNVVSHLTPSLADETSASPGADGDVGAPRALPGRRRSRDLENQKRLFHLSLRPSSTQRILNQRENCERKPVDSQYSSRQEPRPSRGGYKHLRSPRRA